MGSKSETHSQWNVKIWRNLSDVEVNEFMQLSAMPDNMNIIRGKVASRTWRWEKSGRFSVKSATRILVQGDQRVVSHKQV